MLRLRSAACPVRTIGSERSVVARGRPDRRRQDALSLRPGPPAGRRGRQRRLDAALPGHGHRHRQAAPGTVAGACRITCCDIWDVTEPASVAEYQAVARAAIDEIAGRGRVPLLVGGSGLYVRAVLEQFEFPGTDAGLRAELEAELAGSGRPRCTPGWPSGTRPRRRGSCPATAGGSCGRWRWCELTGGAVRGRAARTHAVLPGRPHRSGPRHRRAWTSGSPPGSTQMWADGPGRRGARRWSGAGCGRGGPPAGRWATSRCCALPGRRVRPSDAGPAETVAGHPAVRAPPALLVPPRPGRACGSTAAHPTCSRGPALGAR